MTTASSASPPITNTAFGKDLKDVARLFRTSLSSMMTSAGLDPQDPQILSRRWGVNKTLSWKISKVIQTDDPFLALQQVPGREGIDILLKKGELYGVKAQFVEATKVAVDRFERLIEAHCGDRATFEMMGSEVTPLGRQQRDEQHRKQLFQGASYVLGVQARLLLSMRVLGPGVRPGSADMSRVAGLLDFRRLREDVCAVVSRRFVNHDDGKPFPLSNPEPLDPASAGQVIPLLPEFCSRPTPALKVTRDATTATVELEPTPVGNAGVISYVTGDIQRNLPLVRNEQDQFAHFLSIADTPAEMFVYDLYLHESMSYAMPPTAMLRRLVAGWPASPDHERYRLPMFEPLLDLGSADPAPVTPEVPRYAELLQTMFSRTGWSASEFRGFRIKMAYPPISTALVMRYALPEA